MTTQRDRRLLDRVRIGASREADVTPMGYDRDGANTAIVPGDAQGPYFVRRPNEYQTYVTGDAFESAVLVKERPGRVVSVRVLRDAPGNADRWVIFFDRASVPVLGAEPDWRVLLPGKILQVTEEPPDSLWFDNGIVVALSTTPLTYTPPGGDEAIFQVQFE